MINRLGGDFTLGLFVAFGMFFYRSIMGLLIILIYLDFI